MARTRKREDPINVKICAELEPLQGLRVGELAIVGAGTPQQVRAALLLLGVSPDRVRFADGARYVEHREGIEPLQIFRLVEVPDLAPTQAVRIGSEIFVEPLPSTRRRLVIAALLGVPVDQVRIIGEAPEAGRPPATPSLPVACRARSSPPRAARRARVR